MDKQMSREEFCEICKSEGLEVVCDDTGYGPNSIHATAYIISPVLSKERDSFADWDYDREYKCTFSLFKLQYTRTTRIVQGRVIQTLDARSTEWG